MLRASIEYTLASLQRFLTTPLEPLLARYAPLNVAQDRLTDSDIPRFAAERAVGLFHVVAEYVPAYRAFLEAQGIQPTDIKTLADFERLPLLTKDNYLRRYPLPDLCRNGKLESCDMIAVSSGSTGTPCFWPRFVTDELDMAWRFEQIFHDSFRADERKTLAVICFALGTWVGGMYTASCCRHLAAKGYPLTVITPGNNKDEILRVVQELGGFYDQVVLCGYPPFLKDVVDTGLARGVNWPQYHIKMAMAGEVFSEEWRDLVGARLGADDCRYDFASLYGTADAGILGNETPLSICIRRFLASHPDAARALFGESRLPTLVQYDPLSRYFEVHPLTEGCRVLGVECWDTPEGAASEENSVNTGLLGNAARPSNNQESPQHPTPNTQHPFVNRGQLLFSGDNGIPLLRYNILDTGGIVAYEDMLAFLADYGFDPVAALPAGGRGARALPFVFVFGRSDFTVSYFGANIYPENITVGLEQPDVAHWVTGKFVLEVIEDADRNRHLSVAVELAPNVMADDAKRDTLARLLQTHLLRLNSEFANYVPVPYQVLQVQILPHSDPACFPQGVKHRYTRKS